MSMWQCRLIEQWWDGGTVWCPCGNVDSEQWWDGGTVWCPCGNVDSLNSGGMEELSGVHVAM